MVIGDQIEVADTIVANIDDIKSEDKKQIEAEELEIIKDVEVIVDAENPPQEEVLNEKPAEDLQTEAKTPKEKKHPKFSNIFRRLSGEKKKEIKKECSKEKIEDVKEDPAVGTEDQPEVEDGSKSAKKEEKHTRVTNLFRRLSLDRRGKKSEKVDKKGDKDVEIAEEPEEPAVEATETLPESDKVTEAVPATTDEDKCAQTEPTTPCETQPKEDDDTAEKSEVKSEKKFTLRFNNFFKRSKDVQSPTTPKADEPTTDTTATDLPPGDTETKTDEQAEPAKTDSSDQAEDKTEEPENPSDEAAPAEADESKVKSPDAAHSRFHVKLPHLSSVFKKQNKTPVS